jgi:hypothetical protein
VDRQAAHRTSFELAVPKVARALELGAPLAVYALDEKPEAFLPPPLRAARVAEVREAVRVAELALDGIDIAFLEPPDRVRLQGYAFGLERISVLIGGDRPTRTDPTYALGSVADLLELWERTGPSCRGCAAGLEAATGHLRAARADLGAASRAAIEGARRDVAELTARVDRHGPEDALRLLRAELEATGTWLDDLAKALSSAPSGAWGRTAAPAGPDRPVVRRPDRWGVPTLRKWLENDEAIGANPPELVPGLVAAVAHFKKVAAEYARSRDAPAPVTAARCEARMDMLSQWAEGKPDPVARVDCDALAKRLADTPMTEDALALVLVTEAWVEPRLARRRREYDRGLALIQGSTAPFSYRHAAAIGALASMPDAVGARLAIEEAIQATCLAGAAIWLHAEVGNEDKLRAWLATDCEGKAADEIVDEALSQPRRALEGLALMVVPKGPANAAMLDRYGWAPFGLAELMATPPDDADPPQIGFEVLELEP